MYKENETQNWCDGPSKKKLNKNYRSYRWSKRGDLTLWVAWPATNPISSLFYFFQLHDTHLMFNYLNYYLIILCLAHFFFVLHAQDSIFITNNYVSATSTTS